jgi:hypothetical protein
MRPVRRLPTTPTFSPRVDGFYRTNVAAQVGRVMQFEYLRTLIATNRLHEWVDWASERITQLRPVEAVPKMIPTDDSLNDHLAAHDTKCAYLRWHDSGDLFHADYASALFEVCRNTPKVLHWLPTRMGGLVAKLVRAGERVPPNLTIQISCHCGGMLEKAQHAAAAEIRHAQPGARVGVTYAHAGLRSRLVNIEFAHF